MVKRSKEEERFRFNIEEVCKALWALKFCEIIALNLKKEKIGKNVRI